MHHEIELRKVSNDGINGDKNAIVYENFSSSRIETFIASSPSVREILREPEIRSVEFQKLLSEGLRSTLKSLFSSERAQINMFLGSNPIDVLYILRGGLNFDLHTSLYETTTIMPEVSFISSQRVTQSQGFSITEATYQKLSIQDNAVLCVGDISATATTIKHALNQLIAAYNLQMKKPLWLLFVTIGTSDALNALVAYQEVLNHAWSPHFKGMTIVFLEQAFTLYKNNAIFEAFHLPFTDFFRKGYLSAPEFEYDCLSNPVCFLERCAIYDGGSRAFEPHTYLSNLYGYWKRLLEHSQTLPMDVLLSLKSNLLDYERPYNEWVQRGEGWHISEQRLHELYAKGQEALDFLHSHSLQALCEQRLHAIEQQMTDSR